MNQETENRRHQRKSRKEKIFIEVLAAQDEQADSLTFECHTEDISRSGLKIKSRYPLIVNSILEMLINFKSSQQKFLLTGEVKWLKKMSDDEFAAGFELIESEHSDYLIWHKVFDIKNSGIEKASRS